jgi:hypothetical protein
VIQSHSAGLLDILEWLAYIPSIAVGDVLNQSHRFQVEQEEDCFLELLALYSTNANMLREFALHLEATYLFPISFQGSGKLASSSGSGGAPLSKQFLQRKEFLNLMEESEYAIIRPHELRKRFTEFVTFNKARALLPSKKKKLKKQPAEDKVAKK